VMQIGVMMHFHLFDVFGVYLLKICDFKLWAGSKKTGIRGYPFGEAE
jgi:hypothetical protein